MANRITKIQKRLEEWEKQKAIGTEGWWDGIRHYEPQLCEDIKWLLDELGRKNWEDGPEVEVETLGTEVEISNLRMQIGILESRISRLEANRNNSPTYPTYPYAPYQPYYPSPTITCYNKGIGKQV